jgi:hypothetical protein
MRQGLVLRITPDGPDGVHFVADFNYVARYDGRPYEVRGTDSDTVQLQLADPHTVIAVYRRDNQISSKENWLISADGRQMTLTATGTRETGQRYNETLVFKKQ